MEKHSVLYKKQLHDLGLKEISIYKMNLKRCIISKCGGHGSDSIQKTLCKKIEDIKKLGFCLWAHGNLNSKHTRKFCSEGIENGQQTMFVIMPYTLSNVTKTSGDIKFVQYKVDTEIIDMPSEMNPVTGPTNSRAFVFEKLYYLKEEIDKKELYKLFWAINNGDIRKDASITLSGSCSNKCVEMREYKNVNSCLKKVIVNDKSGIIVGKLKKPFHVELLSGYLNL